MEVVVPVHGSSFGYLVDLDQTPDGPVLSRQQMKLNTRLSQITVKLGLIGSALPEFSRRLTSNQSYLVRFCDGEHKTRCVLLEPVTVKEPLHRGPLRLAFICRRRSSTAPRWRGRDVDLEA